MVIGADSVNQSDKGSASAANENNRLHEQAIERLSSRPTDKVSGIQSSSIDIHSKNPVNQQRAFDEGLSRSGIEKLYESSTGRQDRITSRDKPSKGDGGEKGGQASSDQSAKHKAENETSKKDVKENAGNKTSKQAESGLNEKIDKIIATQPEAQAAESLRSTIFDLYYPKGSAARDNFIQELNKSGQESDAKALRDKGITPPFKIGTGDGLPVSREFSSSNNPKDKVSVFDTINTNVIGMVTDKNIILLNTAQNEHREIPLDSNQIKGHPDDKAGTRLSLAGQLSLEQQADKSTKSDPAKAARLYQLSFRLADQQLKNRGVSIEGIEFAQEHSHRGHLLSGLGEDKPIDAAAAIKEYQLAGKIYEKLNGPDNINTIRNKYDLLEVSYKAYGATESNKQSFQELQQRRIKSDPSEEEKDLFDSFVIRYSKSVTDLYPKK